ncbi:MAG: DUF177 domain-containing protein [Acidimicrobiia bacterium]
MRDQPFEFHLGDLRSGRSAPRTLSGRVAVDWRVELSRVLTEPPLFFELEVAQVPGGMSVSGVIEAALAHSCYRCLTEWTEEVVRDVAQMLVSGGDEDDDYRITSDTYDFEDMIRDELMLSLPIAPLCGPDCEGLVVEAGSDLNTNLSEDEAVSGSPFSVLKDLLDSGE